MKMISPFPAFRQTYLYDCGALALEAILAYYGIDVKEYDVMKKAGTTPSKGTTVEGIKKTARSYGLKAFSKAMTVDEIKEFIDRNIPVLIPLQAWTDKHEKIDWELDWVDGHYVVAIGYDNKKFYFEDPSSIVHDYLTFEEFEKRWHDMGNGKNRYIGYGIVIHGKKKKYQPEKPIHMD